MTDEDANLLHYMPIIVRAPDLSDWERTFCASMIRRSKRAAFTPSDKQRGVMRRIVREFQEAMLRDDDVPAEVGDWRPIGDVVAGLVGRHG